MNSSPFSSLIGKYSLVRSRGSGVWAGTVVEAHEGLAGHTLTMKDARRIWSWTGAAECAALALVGPKDGKITMPANPIVAEVVEAHEMTPVAELAIADIPVWER